MAEGTSTERAFKCIVEHYKAPSAVVTRAAVATLLCMADLISDIFTIVSLFALDHHGPAYALLLMVCTSLLVQVGSFRVARLTRWAWATGGVPQWAGSAGRARHPHHEAPRLGGALVGGAAGGVVHTTRG